jgi:hypothetical protein
MPKKVAKVPEESKPPPPADRLHLNGRHDPSANGHANGKAAEAKTYRDVFATLGVEFTKASGDEAVGECPWCGGGKFYLNVPTGKYQCKTCQEKGNATTFLTRLHGRHLEATTAAQRSRLASLRGVSPQTVARHEWAYDAGLGCWLIPFKNERGNVVNLVRYFPDRKKPNKFKLPLLPTCIYGFDRLAKADAKGKFVYLCEGPPDALAADYGFGEKHRGRNVVVATPGAFKEDWAEHFRGFKVRLLYDNDGAGAELSDRAQKLLTPVAAEVRVLKWPDGTPDKYDVNDFVREHPKGLATFVKQNSYEVVAEPRLAWSFASDVEVGGPEVIEWVWPHHLRCGTYASFSGFRGTLKSTVARELIARYTRGEPMPGCDEPGLPAGHVILVTAEDDVKTATASLRVAGADTGRVIVMGATLKGDGDPLNVLEHLTELRQLVRRYGVRFVVIDGQNSVVGAPNISTDMLARHNVTNRLHQFAQQESLCLMGLRNEDPDGRAYGPASMGDLGRCILRAVELEPFCGERYFKLVFERISDTSPKNYPPIPYAVEDLGGSARRILWDVSRPGKQEPLPDAEDAEAKVLKFKEIAAREAKAPAAHKAGGKP